MGILDFVKKGVQEMMIHRPDDKKGLIVYKHPENTIPNHAQLTVDADEAAVFFRDGAFVGVLRTAGAGQRHTLSSENIPFLGSILDKFTGGGIFVTDLYFVTMKPMYDQGFGGPLGYMEDPMLGEMVTPRIFGRYSFQIVDPARFIVGYTGLTNIRSNDQVLAWVKDTMMRSAKQVVGTLCVSQQKSLLQLMPMQEEIGKALEQNAPDLTNIGLKVLQISDFTINLDDADEARLKDAQSEIGAAKRGVRIAQAEAQARQFKLDQDLAQDTKYTGLAGGDFTRAAAGKAMIGAGEGMAKGGGAGGGDVMAGAGMGVGMGMAGAMMGAFQQPGRTMQQQQQHGQAAAGGQIQCGACGAACPPGKFCASCGTSLAPTPRVCGGCNHENGPTSKFCANCGTPFGA